MTNEIKTQKPIWKKWWFWGAAVVIVITISSSGDDKPTVTTENPETTQPAVETSEASVKDEAEATQVAPKTDQEILEDSLKSSIPESIGSTDFSYKGTEVEKTDTDRPAGTKMITVSVGIGSFYNKSALIRDTGKLSSQLFQTVFQSAINAYDVIVWYYSQTTDKYGNIKDSVVLTYAMDKDTYAKINWSNFDQASLCDFLNQEFKLNLDWGTGCNVLANIQ